jgi:putative iron-only hydrogenase system regulator
LAIPVTVLGIMVDQRGCNAPEVQEVITKHGTDIICRMGVPSPSKEQGLITLVFEGDLQTVQQFQNELEEIKGVNVKTMSFPQ